MTAKKYLWLLIILFILVVSTMGHLFQLNSKPIKEKDYPEIKAFGALQVVMEYNTSDYYVEGNSIAGVQYELCKYISQRSGLELNIRLENNLDTSIKDLQNKTVDIIARNIPITIENREILAFTVPVTQNKQVLIQRITESEKDSVYIANQIELAHKTIYLPEGSPAKFRIKNLSEEIAEPIYIKEIKEYAQEQLLYMVALGEIDYAVIDKDIALKNKVKFPEIDMYLDISFTQLQAWAVRKNSPILLDSLNTWIRDYQLTKTIQ
jgi:Predicted soluble lytic transglycosylase fused to an ABC-type amino acid-binding protein